MREAARRLDRRLDRDDDLLARRLDDGGRDLAERATVHVGRVRVDQALLGQLARDERDAAGAVDVRGDVPAARLEAREDRRTRRDLVEVLELVRDPELARDREQVEDAVRRAAGRRHRGGRVVERLAGDDRARAQVLAKQLHRELARLVGGLVLALLERGDPVQARGRDPEEVERGRHRVRGVLAAAGARGRAGDVLERVHVLRAHRPGRVGADRLEHVLDRHVLAAEAPGRDRAVVEHERGEVEPRDRHHRGRDRLVAADQADEAVEEVSARDELDRVGDHLARDERGAHPHGAHRDPVRDRDRVELHRRAAGVADPALHVLGERALVEVARHRLDPRGRDADQRAREVLVGEAGALQHRARGGAVGAVGERGGMTLVGVGRAVVWVRHCHPFSIGRSCVIQSLQEPA